jgi:hypothetical protein
MKTKTLDRIDQTATDLGSVASEILDYADDVAFTATSKDWATIYGAAETLTAARDQLLSIGPDYLDAAEAFVKAGRAFIGTTVVKDRTPKLDGSPILPIDAFVNVEADCS